MVSMQAVPLLLSFLLGLLLGILAAGFWPVRRRPRRHQFWAIAQDELLWLLLAATLGLGVFLTLLVSAMV